MGLLQLERLGLNAGVTAAGSRVKERRIEPKHYHSFNRCFLSTLYTPGQALHWLEAA